ncbi:hypothetical protein JCM35486_36210 [Blautia wexlerae]|nr:hypothetical protein DW955_20430 [Ruminococcus sp. AM45-9BH]RHS68953.1 hypothetical protein DW953_20835 [Ruminococcus sp. AM45-2]RHS72334.1 hypothetical protein DW952_16500 [Ruminococcus sp. AM44-9AT]
MSRYLYKKIQNISPESLNFQHSGLKLTTLGSDLRSQKRKTKTQVRSLTELKTQYGEISGKN